MEGEYWTVDSEYKVMQHTVMYTVTHCDGTYGDVRHTQNVALTKLTRNHALRLIQKQTF